jgi:diaminopimelate decarboxylase
LKILNQNNASLDLVSPGEATMALKLGFTQNRLLYTANSMTDEEMHYIKKLGLLFNIDSLSRLEKFGKAFPGSSVCVRFNTDVVAGEEDKVCTAGDATKFGILIKEVDKVKEIVKKYNLKVVGLHEHTGSGIAETAKFMKAINNILNMATRENFPDLEFIDFGGGFKVPYKPEEKRIDYVAFGKEIAQTFTGFCKKYGKELYLYFEPGKYIVAECGYLLVETTTIKNNNGRNIATTNSGFPQLIRPVLYNAYHKITNLSNPDGKPKKFDITGNICETGDLFAAERQISEIREGDILAIHNAGAYCYSMGGIYNLRPMPAEVIVQEGKDRLSRKALSTEELAQSLIG